MDYYCIEVLLFWTSVMCKPYVSSFACYLPFSNVVQHFIGSGLDYFGLVKILNNVTNTLECKKNNRETSYIWLGLYSIEVLNTIIRLDLDVFGNCRNLLHRRSNVFPGRDGGCNVTKISSEMGVAPRYKLLLNCFNVYTV